MGDAQDTAGVIPKAKKVRRTQRIYGGTFNYENGAITTPDSPLVFTVLPGWPAVTTKLAAQKWAKANDDKMPGPIDLIKWCGRITPSRQIIMKLE